jgi:hypothetical protein
VFKTCFKNGYIILLSITWSNGLEDKMKDYLPQDLFDEFLRMQQLKFLVDHAAFMLITKKLKQPQIDSLLDETRQKVLTIFPDKESTYDLIYNSRFKRLIEDFQNK